MDHGMLKFGAKELCVQILEWWFIGFGNVGKILIFYKHQFSHRKNGAINITFIGEFLRELNQIVYSEGLDQHLGAI